MSGSRSLRVLVAPVVAGLLLAVSPAVSHASVPAQASSTVLASSTAVASSTGTGLPPKGTVVGGGRLASSGTLVDLAAGTPAPPAPKAVAWLVADLDSRQIIAAHYVHARRATASTMKIFTALTVAPLLDPAAIYTASPASAAVDGTKVGLVPGSRYTVDQLLHGMIMSSGNDCAVALGELAGGQEKTTALMLADAHSLGAFDTTPRTTSGLDAPGQASSAYDLALGGAAALKNPQLAKIMTTRAFTFPSAGKGLGKTRKTYSIQTHNKLIYNLPGATGVKNGYTVAAKGSFVGSATRNGHSYIAVVLRMDGSTWHAADDLLEWAFANGSAARPVGNLVTPEQAQALIAPPAGALVAPAGGPGQAQVRGAEPAAAMASSGSGVRGSLRMILIAALIAGLLIAVVAGVLILRPGHNRSAAPSTPVPAGGAWSGKVPMVRPRGATSGRRATTTRWRR